MNNVQKIIEIIVNEYSTQEGVEGVFWGGSSSNMELEEFSDIDIFIITNDECLRKKGLKRIYNIEVEYFVNPISHVMQQMEKEIGIFHDYWAIKIYAFSKIVYDKNGKSKMLQQKALSMFNMGFGMIDESTDLLNYYNAHDCYNKYRSMIKNELQWRIGYYECIKALLLAHCYHNRLPLIPWNKAQRLLTDEKYRNAYHLKKMPEEKFCKLFLCCISSETEDKMFPAIDELYHYCFFYSNYNFNDFEIEK